MSHPRMFLSRVRSRLTPITDLPVASKDKLNLPRGRHTVAGLQRAASRLLWKIEKAYSLGIPKKKLALGESQTEEEHAYGRKYTMFWRNGRSFRT